MQSLYYQHLIVGLYETRKYMKNKKTLLREFKAKIRYILALLPQEEGDDGYGYLDIGDIEELKNIRKTVGKLDKIEEGQIVRLQAIGIKVANKIRAEKN